MAITTVATAGFLATYGALKVLRPEVPPSHSAGAARRYRTIIALGTLASLAAFLLRIANASWVGLLVFLASSVGGAAVARTIALREFQAGASSVRSAQLFPAASFVTDDRGLVLAPLAVFAVALVFAFTYPDPVTHAFPGFWSRVAYLEAQGLDHRLSMFWGMWAGTIVALLLVHFTSRRQSAIRMRKRVLDSALVFHYLFCFGFAAVLIATTLGFHIPSGNLGPALRVMLLGLMLVLCLTPEPITAGEVSPMEREPRNWLLGLFYFNRSDPAMMVVRPSGRGYTFNFGRWPVWVLVGAMFALALHR